MYTLELNFLLHTNFKRYKLLLNATMIFLGVSVATVYYICSLLLASERSERDTIRGVQIRADAVRIYIYIYMYGGTCAIIVAHATYI